MLFGRIVSGTILTMLLLGSILTLAFDTQSQSTTLGLEMATSEEYVTDSLIVINQTEYTWYGDFIVNGNDIIIVEDCYFTVVDGFIYVYGELHVRNSTLQIRRNTFQKKLYVKDYGVFNMSNSWVMGYGRIYIGYESTISIYNSTLTSWRLDDMHAGPAGTNVYIFNSTLLGAYYWNYESPASITMLNSNLSEVFLAWDRRFSVAISHTNIALFTLDFERVLNFEDDSGIQGLRQGYIEIFSFLDENRNLTILNSVVDKWEVWLRFGYSEEYREKSFYFSNSEVYSVYLTLFVNVDAKPINLTLNPGFFENESIYSMNLLNITITNSTIDFWDLAIPSGYFRILNSDLLRLSVVAYASSSYYPIVYILNSTVQFVFGYFDVRAPLNASLNISDSTIYSCVVFYDGGSVDLVLQPGYQGYLNIHDEEDRSSVTGVRTVVNHWSIVGGPESVIRIFNSTLVAPFIDYRAFPSLRITSSVWDGLNLIGQANVFVYNSNITLGRARDSSSLNLFNSTMQALYAYDNSNITATNSTIGIIVQDPPEINLLNSSRQMELFLSIPLENDLLSTSIIDDYETPLPPNIKKMSPYLQVTSNYNDVINAQVRIYYNETEIDETRLHVYFLDESNIWQLCPIQGVNIIENYVWANVTHFSCFVIGLQKITSFLMEGPYYTWYGAEYWIVEIGKHPIRLVSNY